MTLQDRRLSVYGFTSPARPREKNPALTLGASELATLLCTLTSPAAVRFQGPHSHTLETHHVSRSRHPHLTPRRRRLGAGSERGAGRSQGRLRQHVQWQRFRRAGSVLDFGLRRGGEAAGQLESRGRRHQVIRRWQPALRFAVGLRRLRPAPRMAGHAGQLQQRFVHSQRSQGRRQPDQSCQGRRRRLHRRQDQGCQDCSHAAKAVHGVEPPASWPSATS